MALFMDDFGGPAQPGRSGFDLAQHVENINGFTVVGAVVYAELLHSGKFHAKSPSRKEVFGLKLGLDAAGAGQAPAAQSFVNGEEARSH